MTFTVDRIDHVVVNCHDCDATIDWYVRVLGMRREEFGGERSDGGNIRGERSDGGNIRGERSDGGNIRGGRIALTFGQQKLNVRPTGAPNWVTADADVPGSLDLCFIVDADAAEIGAHLRACGVQITEGPVAKTGALGAMTSHYCRDPEGNLVEVATYRRHD